MIFLRNFIIKTKTYIVKRKLKNKKSMFFGYVYMIFRFTNAKCNSIIKEQICTCADIFLLDLNITSVL